VRICASDGRVVVARRSAARIDIPFRQSPQGGTCTSIHACFDRELARHSFLPLWAQDAERLG
jgi:hypothetical protein